MFSRSKFGANFFSSSVHRRLRLYFQATRLNHWVTRVWRKRRLRQTCRASEACGFFSRTVCARLQILLGSRPCRVSFFRYRSRTLRALTRRARLGLFYRLRKCPRHYTHELPTKFAVTKKFSFSRKSLLVTSARCTLRKFSA